MKHTFLTVLIALLVLPVQTLAAVSVSADDTVAGMGTDIDVLGLVPGQESTVVITPPLGNELITTVKGDDGGKAHVHVAGSETELAGIYSVHIEQLGKTTGVPATFEVLADTAHIAGSIESDISYMQANGNDAAAITVILRDRYGNPLANRPLKLISSRAADTVTPLQQTTNAEGEQTFTFTTTLAGTATLRAMDFVSGNFLTTELSIDAGSSMHMPAMGGAVPSYATDRTLYGSSSTTNTAPSFYGSALRAQLNAGPIDHFVIVAPRELHVNEDATIRISAVDANGNKVEDYTGTALLSSTDPAAFLPIGGTVPFRVQDLGEKQLTLGLRFRTADEHILHVEDAANPNIMGEIIINVTGGTTGNSGNTKLIQISEPGDKALINTATVTISGTAEPFVNLIVTGGKTSVEGETDIHGAFSIDVELDTEKADQTLRVKDESGTLDSGDIHLKLDLVPPNVSSIAISPEEPVEGTDALVVAEVDPDIVDFSATLNGEPLTMEKAPGQQGKYQGLFKAPEAGSNDIRVIITDAAGNQTTNSFVFASKPKGLPRVSGLTATTENDVIALTWDPVTSEPVDAYRIYVGETPTEFAFSLDSDFATSAAQIAGLQPGTDYYFAVTALRGERESDQKSDVVQATLYGIRIDVKPQTNGLMLDWSNMHTNSPLSSFILEYGVEPGVYTEKRILNGDLRNYTIRDILGEVTYYVQLTPVSLTGEILEKLVATSEGKPLKTAAGFQPTPGDPVPTEIGNAQLAQTTPPPNLHSSAPATPHTGLPSVAWWITAFLAATGLLVYWNRKRTLQRTILFLQAMEERYQQQ